MVFAKEGKRKAGRPLGSTATGYSDMSDAQKVEYHGSAVKKHREKPEEIPTVEAPPIEQTPPCTSGRKKSETGPMTPNTRTRVRSGQQRARRKKQKVSAVRSKLQYERWSTNKENEQQTDESDGDDEESNAGDEDGDETQMNIEPAATPTDTQSHSNTTAATERRQFRCRALLRGQLTKNCFDNLQMLLHYVNTTATFPDSVRSELQKVKSITGILSPRQIRYRIQKLNDGLKRAGKSDVDLLLNYWLGLLLDDPCIESIFDNATVDIDKEYLPKSVLVARSASRIGKSLVTSRRNVTDDIKKAGVNI